jgi:hypothetical protein
MVPIGFGPRFRIGLIGRMQGARTASKGSKERRNSNDLGRRKEELDDCDAEREAVFGLRVNTDPEAGGQPVGRVRKSRDSLGDLRCFS